MNFGAASYGLALLAGLLSTLSPCVLPIIPILLGSATNAHPRVPLALAGRLALSYAVIGTAIAWAAASLGLETAIFRTVGAILLGAIGLVLMSAVLQERFATATSSIGQGGNRLLERVKLDGLRGQFAVGVVLAIVWSPCVGPTLGGAIVLASHGANLPQVALLMGVFGVGAALPIVELAYASRAALTRMRGNLIQAGKRGKAILGDVMVLLSVGILSGADKPLESWLVEHSPAWLTTLTTRF